MIKKIFFGLAKIPIMIMVVFLAFNVFAFVISYFRIMGVTHTLQQVVIDNNYLTDKDKETFETYLRKLETSYLTNIRIVINTSANDGTATDRYTFINDRKQYGNVIEVGVAADYRFIMPLMPTQMSVDGKGVAGLNGQFNNQAANGSQTYADNNEMERRRNNNVTGGSLDIIETVVGLQYYSDLE